METLMTTAFDLLYIDTSHEVLWDYCLENNICMPCANDNMTLSYNIPGITSSSSAGGPYSTIAHIVYSLSVSFSGSSDEPKVIWRDSESGKYGMHRSSWWMPER